MKVLLLHGYSATNAGDGLLVDESIGLIRDVVGSDAEVTLLASRPETFSSSELQEVINSRPTISGYSRRYLETLRDIREYDYVFGVGGGYLRAGTMVEALKCALVHGPQLIAARRVGERVAYLPQSIGPARWPAGLFLRLGLSSMASVCVRDDRSLAQFPVDGVARFPDLALLSKDWSPRTSGPVGVVPVLSVRATRGDVPRSARDLAARLGTFDGYVQSRGASNDDVEAMDSVRPSKVLSREEMLSPSGKRRVVCAMRLHGALMAMAAGHYVIHLSYERKGFGAYSDLGLGDYVHNVFRFDPGQVQKQIESLTLDPEARAEYDQRVASARFSLSDARERLVQHLRTTLDVAD
ncbi:polysaccharide pyruvyl transferase family protein [Cellulomonas sp. PSBB021]|uniref:polysaccharide pyruvyl transferase family protein n=1 Tax=Cellulomonas sp. PSBB021 TaxID=2003551 RepID=UPI000B8D6DC2|nr:polysaccharide pyruvyl transferase family protein [Cellulomonas sp. PSBB021]ASR56426.1 hypothetical protein CBP52_16455 [Cellulomonas sp. PSBB021]